LLKQNSKMTCPSIESRPHLWCYSSHVRLKIGRSWSGWAESDNKTGKCCHSTKHAALRSYMNYCTTMYQTTILYVTLTSNQYLLLLLYVTLTSNQYLLLLLYVTLTSNQYLLLLLYECAALRSWCKRLHG
jgi:hypothetical protein